MVKTRLQTDMDSLRSKTYLVRNDLQWIKLMGGAALAGLVLPGLAETVGTAIGH